MNISEIIKILCVKKEISVAELSVKLGNTKQNLFNKLYRNDMKVSDLEKIAETLDCELKISFVDKLSNVPLL
ncbi:helix-turn-helix domain-containing protein [uncultured Treponema sp.]|uniref:helix-turn-helix domain-containing protein n=1 Tax=uncultured Treponema sp. TaxID=162155 RepID=UPI0015B92D80|nr:helix-turn-helix domain-containing protein [uncultured Treponema sp.]